MPKKKNVLKKKLAHSSLKFTHLYLFLSFLFNIHSVL